MTYKEKIFYYLMLSNNINITLKNIFSTDTKNWRAMINGTVKSFHDQ